MIEESLAVLMQKALDAADAVRSDDPATLAVAEDLVQRAETASDLGASEVRWLVDADPEGARQRLRNAITCKRKLAEVRRQVHCAATGCC